MVAERRQRAAPAGTGEAPFAALPFGDDDRDVEPHQGPRFGRPGAVRGHHQHGLEVQGKAHVDLLHPVVNAARRLIRTLQQRHLVLLAKRRYGIALTVDGRRIAGRQGPDLLFASGPRNGTRRLHGVGQAFGTDVLGVGGAGLLTAERTHAQAPVEAEGALLDDAILERPTLQDAVLQEQLAQVGTRSGQAPKRPFGILAA